MGRHRQSREVAALTGALRNHPERYRKVAPRSPHPLGNPPAHLSSDERTAWKEIEKYAPPGVIGGSDRAIVEIASVLLAQLRRDAPAFPTSKLGCLITCLAKLGLTPTARQSLGVAEKPKDPSASFDEF